MPVNSPHPDYKRNVTAWTMIRDALGGDQAVKMAGERYLPKLHGQTEKEYAAYVMRANFYGATERTQEAYVGMLTRKPPVVTAGAELDPFREDVNLTGLDFDSYVIQVIETLCSTSRAGTLIDWAEFQKRPYVTHYTEEQILNWRVEMVGGRPRLTMLVLEECLDQPSSDPFIGQDKKQYRVYTLMASTDPETQQVTTAVRVDIWRHKGDAQPDAPATTVTTETGSEFIIVATAFPTRRGVWLPDIPFVFHGLTEDRTNVSKPLLLDVATVNFAHYRNSADHENGLHICGIPTPYVFGVSADAPAIYLGSSAAIVSTNPDATAGFLEYTGAGMESILKAMQEKEKMMAALGARAIQPEKADAEATQTVAMRANAETASLNNVASMASLSLSDVLAWVAWWQGTAATRQELGEDTFVTVNRDFVGGQADPSFISSLMSSWMSGAMSFETLYHNFQRGELYPPDWSMEKEQAAMKTNPPPAPDPAPAGGGA